MRRIVAAKFPKIILAPQGEYSCHNCRLIMAGLRVASWTPLVWPMLGLGAKRKSKETFAQNACQVFVALFRRSNNNHQARAKKLPT